MTQLSLIPEFDGATYSPELDGDRLRSQFWRIKELMLDGEWRTLAQIARRAGGSEAGVSARLRDLRKARFGSFTVERERGGEGLWWYRVKP